MVHHYSLQSMLTSRISSAVEQFSKGNQICCHQPSIQPPPPQTPRQFMHRWVGQFSSHSLPKPPSRTTSTPLPHPPPPPPTHQTVTTTPTHRPLMRRWVCRFPSNPNHPLFHHFHQFCKKKTLLPSRLPFTTTPHNPSSLPLANTSPHNPSSLPLANTSPHNPQFTTPQRNPIHNPTTSPLRDPPSQPPCTTGLHNSLQRPPVNNLPQQPPQQASSSPPVLPCPSLSDLARAWARATCSNRERKCYSARHDAWLEAPQ